MSVTKNDLLSLARDSNEESDLLDFKREYSPEKKAAFWAETVKDIVAFANTRGGIILFGIEDDGTCSGIDCSKLFDLDTAALTDQIRKYTGFNFQGISIVHVVRGERTYPAILVEPISIPMVFTKVGTYEYAEGKQKTAFSLGTIYFRHGSKSEPCTRDDILEKVNAELDRIRNEWLGNIRSVVEAEPGSKVIIAQTESASSGNSVRVTNDPTAPLARLPRLSDGYPHRQSDVIAAVNMRIKGLAKVNSHDIQAIKLFEDINPENTPQFVHKPHEQASPQYTDEFVDLIVAKYHENDCYFSMCRENYKATKY